MLPAGDQDEVELVNQSSVPKDGRNYRSKHVELIEIINNKIIFASSFIN